MHVRKKVLICPLDWGIGHASRCIPVIEQFIKSGYEIVVAADQRILPFLQSELPDLKHIVLKGYGIKYSRHIPLIIKLISQIPKIIYRIIKEHYQLRKIVKEHNVNIIVSDNRFGLWNNKTYNIYITHQIWIKSPIWLKIFEGFLSKVHRRFINRYNECWIPDYADTHNLSGELSHKSTLPANCRYVGMLSKFSNIQVEPAQKYDLLVILSGPEPQRTVLKNLIITQLQNSGFCALILTGNPRFIPLPTQTNSKIKEIGHLNKEQLAAHILAAKIVISRAGYTTLMDLVTLKKSAILIPTPNQTEQEYLADYLAKKKMFYFVKQSDFDLKIAIREFLNFEPIFEESHYRNELFTSAVESLSKNIQIKARFEII